MSDKPPTARSYRGTLVDDNMVFSFNIKWLGQILVLCGMLVYGYWNIVSRIEMLEDGMAASTTQIGELVDRHIEEEQIRYAKMEKEEEEISERIYRYLFASRGRRSGLCPICIYDNELNPQSERTD